MASRRIWLWAAPFLVGSVVFAVTLTVAVVTQPGMARTAARFVIQHGMVIAARAGLEFVNYLWASVSASWSGLALAGVPPAAALFAAAAIWAICVWGLYRTLRVAVPGRKTVHAKR